jgi:hypothetical protein
VAGQKVPRHRSPVDSVQLKRFFREWQFGCCLLPSLDGPYRGWFWGGNVPSAIGNADRQLSAGHKPKAAAQVYTLTT